MLIVEDNKINCQYLAGILDNWRIPYEVAENGKEGVWMAKQKKYDTILMDIRMPVMDGYEAARIIRSDSLNKNTPILALTASSIVDEKGKALEAGMNQYLPKPFTPQQLASVFREFEVFPSEEGTERLFNFSDKLDVDYLIELYDTDFERAQIIFEIFMGSIMVEVEKLEQLFVAKDWEKFSVQAHKLKPNFYMVGVKELGDRMLEFEKARDGGLDTLELSEKYMDYREKFPQYHDIVSGELSRLNSFLGI